jgi:DNA modification methylase
MMRVLQGDCLDILPTLAAESVQTCVTSPPYWGLRDYGNDSQLGLEATPEEYIINMVRVFREVWRVLRDDGTCWINIGDSYANDTKWGGQTGGKHVEALHGANGIGQRSKRTTGLKPKDLCGIPWRLAFALQEAGWYLRSEIIWAKPNPMPESVLDRPTKSHEQIFLLTKRASYFYDAAAIREPAIGTNNHDLTGTGYNAPGQTEQTGNRRKRRKQALEGRNKRSVWTVATQPYAEAHFATFPTDLIKPCILAGSRLGDTVLDPFAGSGTVGLVATEYGRKAVLIELNPAYVAMIEARTNVTVGML